MQRFSDAVVYYSGFLAAIFNTKIVQRTQLCPRPLASDYSSSFLSENKFLAIFARVFLEQVVVLKISFVTNIRNILTFLLQELG